MRENRPFGLPFGAMERGRCAFPLGHGLGAVFSMRELLNLPWNAVAGAHKARPCLAGGFQEPHILTPIFLIRRLKIPAPDSPGWDIP